jgi:hypothetical protein
MKFDSHSVLRSRISVSLSGVKCHETRIPPCADHENCKSLYRAAIRWREVRKCPSRSGCLQRLLKLLKCTSPAALKLYGVMNVERELWLRWSSAVTSRYQSFGQRLPDQQVNRSQEGVRPPFCQFWQSAAGDIADSVSLHPRSETLIRTRATRQIGERKLDFHAPPTYLAYQ